MKDAARLLFLLAVVGFGVGALTALGPGAWNEITSLNFLNNLDAYGLGFLQGIVNDMKTTIDMIINQGLPELRRILGL